MMKTVAVLVISVSALATAFQSLGATIPAGTVFVVRSLHAVSSIDVAGTPFPAQLAHNITVKGKVVLPAGTRFSGRIVTSRRLAHSSDRLTVDLTGIQPGGHNIPITTTGAQFLSNNVRSRHDVSVSRAGYSVAAGKEMHFQLARPVVF
jgi:hypothetical protein